MRLVFGDPSEDDDNLYYRVVVAFKSDGTDNMIIWQDGYHIWPSGGSGTRESVTASEGSFNYMTVNAESYGSEHVVTVPKRSTICKVRPWAKIMGIYKSSTNNSGYANGSYWDFGNNYGVLDIRSFNTSNCLYGGGTYGSYSFTFDAFIMFGNSSGSGKAYGDIATSAAAPYTIAAKGSKQWDLWVYNSSGVPKRAQDVYVYNSSGVPKAATNIYVYNSSGVPKEVSRSYVTS